MEKYGVKSHFFPTFYGDFVGIQGAVGGFDMLEEHALLEGDLKDQKGLDTDDRHSGLKMIYRSTQVHNSLVTLTFTAESVAFVENRYVHVDFIGEYTKTYTKYIITLSCI